MSVQSIPTVVIAGISFYVGLYHLLIYHRRRQHREDLTFALMCLATSLYDVFCAGLYSATSVAEGAQWQRMQFIALAVLTTAFLWFVSDYTRQKPGIATYAFSAYYLLAILIQIVDKSHLTWLVDQPAIKEIALPLGLQVTYYEATLGPLTALQGLVGMAASTYILWISVRFYRRGYRREAVPLILALGFMFAAAINDTVVSNNLYQFVYAIEYGYMAMILLMAYSLSSTVVEVAMTKKVLRASEERFRSLVETTSDWVWEIDPNGVYTYASPKVRELLGYEAEEIIGKTPLDLMPPDEVKRVGTVFRDIVDSHSPFERLENTAQHKDGRLVVLETNGVPFFDANGKLAGYRGIDRDITERKQAEEALRESEGKYRSIVENALAGIFIVDDAYHFVYVNDEMCRIMQYSNEEFIGLDFRNVLTDDSRAFVTEYYIRRQRGEQPPPRYELSVVRHDGQVRHAEMSVAVVRDAAGRLRTVGQLVDITERKWTEKQVQQRLDEMATVNAVSQVAASQLELNTMLELTGEKLRQILNVHAAYIALYDAPSNLISFPYWRIGDGTIKVSPIPFGRGLTSIVIRTREPLVINRDYQQRSAELGVVHQQAWETSQVRTKSWLGVPMQVRDQVIGVISVQNYEQEDAFTDDDVRLWSTIATNVGIAVQNAQLYTATQQELAERKQIQLEREKLIAELETKNAELERFTYSVSHDLKAPLVTIRGFLGFLEKDAMAGNVERLKADANRITQATDKMQRLLTELLELSRIGRMMNPPQAAPFEAIAREALELAHGRIEARGVQVDIVLNLPTVQGDRARLVEVVQNLVDNACKFMGDQPEPRIEIGQRGNDADGKPILFVRDNGIGIDPQYQEQIFGLFNKLDAQAEGTGVGLALAKRIVEVHGGRIWVESEGAGQGATFCFTLPGG